MVVFSSFYRIWVDFFLIDSFLFFDFIKNQRSRKAFFFLFVWDKATTE